MTFSAAQANNRNSVRSDETRSRLVEATISSLIEQGFSKTTGVEVCRRASLTRGALNHHFPDFADLLVETLQRLYQHLLEIELSGDLALGNGRSKLGPLERVLLQAHQRVIRPEFKAVIELWLASKNDADFGQRLTQAIEPVSYMFTPEMVLGTGINGSISDECEATYRTIIEAIIGIGLGRAVGGGEPLPHETRVLPVLQRLARQVDAQHLQLNSK